MLDEKGNYIKIKKVIKVNEAAKRLGFLQVVWEIV